MSLSPPPIIQNLSIEISREICSSISKINNCFIFQPLENRDRERDLRVGDSSAAASLLPGGGQPARGQPRPDWPSSRPAPQQQPSTALAASPTPTSSRPPASSSSRPPASSSSRPPASSSSRPPTSSSSRPPASSSGPPPAAVPLDEPTTARGPEEGLLFPI